MDRKLVHAVTSKCTVLSPPPTLVFSGSPSAIFLFVPTIYVDAVKGVFLWGVTHIKKKVLETVSVSLMPPLADQDAPATVVPITDMLLVIATVVHTAPNSERPLVCTEVIYFRELGAVFGS